MGGKGRIGSHRTEHNRRGQDSIGDWIQVLQMRVEQGEVLYIGQTIVQRIGTQKYCRVEYRMGSLELISSYDVVQ